ncbi:MAG TPA: site-2 protease family protein [Longimicrobiaceae bacterium]|nr:site-2 protease family protein [Longimicrobiaceae bacterium]
MEQLLIALPVLILSIVFHEVAHGWVARQQGDPTAAMLGRLTLNPIPHIDPIGSILVPVVLALMPGGVVFGWAKPVPVNPRNFRNYKKGDILVSLAGVAVNFLLAIAFTVILVIAIWAERAAPGLSTTWDIVLQMAQYGILINLVLMLFNLIPIPPLDGSHVMYHLLPPHIGARYRELGRYGMLILFGLLFLGGFQFLLWPLQWLYGLAISVANLFV